MVFVEIANGAYGAVPLPARSDWIPRFQPVISWGASPPIFFFQDQDGNALMSTWGQKVLRPSLERCLAWARNSRAEPRGAMSENVTRISRHINAPRARVYDALLDPTLIAQWRVPDGMTSQVHQFEPREGGSLRISLTYDDPTQAGKTTARTDTYHGRFVTLVPNELIVEEDEFETADPALQGVMISTIQLTDAEGGTHLLAIHEGLPHGVSPEDNETGWNMSLAKLAAIVEMDPGTSDR